MQTILTHGRKWVLLTLVAHWQFIGNASTFTNVTTEPPAIASQTSVRLNGRINPRGQSVDAWFVWGESTNYGNATAPRPIGSGNSFTNFSETITTLSAGMTYYYRAVGSNAQGQIFLGGEERFTLAPPDVTTGPAGNLNPTSATLYGQVNPNNFPAYAWFEWGLTLDDPLATPVQSLGRGLGGFSQNLFDLQPDSTYYFRAVASNDLGVTYGEPQTLVTPRVPCPTYLSPTDRSHGYAGGTGYRVTVWVYCDWAVINTNSWITITSPTNGPSGGPGELIYNVAVNTGPEPRSGDILIGEGTFSMSQAGGHAVILTHPADQSVSGGGTATFNVTVTNTTPVTYQWQLNQQPLVDGNGVSGASTPNLVLTNVQLSQAGGYRVIVTDRGSTIYSRTATLTVSCSFSLTTSNATFNSLSSTGSVTVSTITPNCLWGIVNTNPWVTVLSSIPDAGNGPVVYVLAANPTATARNGNILIADQLFTITQSGGSPTNAFVSLEKALDTEDGLSWDTIGTPAWFGQKVISHDGSDAAQSGSISNNAAVTALSVITGPGTLSWWWKVSSETNRDYLKFFVNGVQQTRISGEVDWQLLTYTFSSGTYTSKWTYSKDGKTAMGNDRGWLDQVQFVPDQGCIAALSQSNAVHSSAPEMGQVSVTAAEGCAWSVIRLSPWITNLVDRDEGNGVVGYTLATNSLPWERTAVVVIGGQPFTVVQEAAPLSCAYSISPATRSYSYAAGTGVVAVTAHEGCRWTVFNTNEWVTILSGSNGFGSSQVTYALAANNTPGARYGYIQIDAQPFFIYQGGPLSCATAISPTLRTHPYTAATAAISVTAYEGCQWRVLNTNEWVTILSGTNGSGSGDVLYSIPDNPLSRDRSGYIRIDAQVFFICQYGRSACTYGVQPLSRTVSAGSTTGVVTVTTQTGCPWSAYSTNAWITIFSGAAGSSSGQVSYSIEANTTPTARTGKIQVANQFFTIVQSGVASPTLADALDAPSLVWTTTGNAPWFGETNLTHDGTDAAQSGAVSNSASSSLQTTVTGPGTLSFWWKVSSEANNDTLRFQIDGSEQALISGEVDWQQRTMVLAAGNHTLQWTYSKNAALSGGQDRAWLDEVQFLPTPLCPVTLSPVSASYPSSYSTGIVSIAAAPDCTWSVLNTNLWIATASDTSGTGNGTLAYVVLSNSTPFARSGNLRIANQVFFVTQASGITNPPGCTFVVSPTNRVHGYGSATNQVLVNTQPGCAWNVVNTNSWVTIRSSLNNSGSGTVAYTIALSTSPDSRSGNVVIGGQLLRLTQLGNPQRLDLTSLSVTGATLSVQGEQGKMYVVECSEDLINWQPIGTNSASSSVTDSPAGNRRQRFYRSFEFK